MKKYRKGDSAYLKAIDRYEKSYPVVVVKVGRKWLYVSKPENQEKRWMWIPVEMETGDAHKSGKEYSYTHKLYSSFEEATEKERAVKLQLKLADRLSRTGIGVFPLEDLLRIAEIVGISETE